MRLFSGIRAALAALVFATPALAAANTSSGDLWEAFCSAPRLPMLNEASAEREARDFTRSKNHFRALLHRAEPWMWHLVQAVRERDMPLDIALLPAVESAFHPQARSSRAAGGFWQLVPDTARRLGVRMNDDFDGRADIAESTRAALDYLQYLYGRFGDWPLAMAAYNAGEARLARAIARNGNHARPHPRDLNLPPETLVHYTRLKGLIRAICSPERYNVRRPTLPARPLIADVTFNRRVRFEEAATLARVPVSELKALNPALPEDSTPRHGPHRLWLPAHRVRYLERALAEVDDLSIARYQTYRVARGDTLSRIALRYGSSVNELQHINRLSGHRIFVGQTLRIPAALHTAR